MARIVARVLGWCPVDTVRSVERVGRVAYVVTEQTPTLDHKGVRGSAGRVVGGHNAWSHTAPERATIEPRGRTPQLPGIPVSVKLTDVADELYGLPLGDFVSSRNQRAKEFKSGGNAEKELAAAVGKLPKPSVAAWAVNMLSRNASDEVGRVLDLGTALQEAQRSLDGAELRELAQQRQALIAAVVGRAREVTSELGQPITDATAEEVEQTLRAAMADPTAATAVRAGRMATAISPIGQGVLDVAAGVEKVSGRAAGSERAAEAGSTTRRRATAKDEKERAERARRRVAEARRDAELAERAAAEADEDLTAQQQRTEEADRSKAALRMEIADLEARLDQARRELTTAGAELKTAERARAASERAAATARRAATRAAERLAELD